jgi:hypothetical protein
MKNM